MNRTMFQTACEALWGPQYRSEAARQLDLGLRTVMRYDAGERSIPAAIDEKLTKLLTDRRKWIDAILAKLPVSP